MRPGAEHELLIEIPGGPFHMRITHQKRECGCWDHPWGSPHTEIITHDADVMLPP